MSPDITSTFTPETILTPPSEVRGLFQAKIIFRTNGGWDVHSLTVQVPNVCPHCGGPRGIPKKENFCEDGEWYNCDRWTNPCGHIDEYFMVRDEHLLFHSNPNQRQFNPQHYEDIKLKQKTPYLTESGQIKIFPPHKEITLFSYSIYPSKPVLIKGIEKGEYFYILYNPQLFVV